MLTICNDYSSSTRTTGTTVTRARWREVLRFPPPQHCPFLLGIERPILLHIVPDMPVQVIRVVTHVSHLLQDRRHDGSLSVPQTLWNLSTY